jgi:hypothetical protein
MKKKTHYLQFRTKNSMESNVSMEGNKRIYCGNKHITNMPSTKLLDLHIDETLS